MGYDGPGLPGYADRILTPCPECAHALWSKVRRVGTLRFVAYINDDERSGTYAEQVRVCSKCDAGLASHTL